MSYGRTVDEPIPEPENDRVQFASPLLCLNCGAGIKDASLAPYPCPLCGSGPLIQVLIMEPK